MRDRQPIRDKDALGRHQVMLEIAVGSAVYSAVSGRHGGNTRVALLYLNLNLSGPEGQGQVKGSYIIYCVLIDIKLTVAFVRVMLTRISKCRVVNFYHTKNINGKDNSCSITS